MTRDRTRHAQVLVWTVHDESRVCDVLGSPVDGILIGEPVLILRMLGRPTRLAG